MPQTLVVQLREVFTAREVAGNAICISLVLVLDTVH